MNNEEAIDTTVGRYRHIVHNINAEQCKQWLNSPITKSLIDILDMCGILAAVQFEEYEGGESDAIIHVLVPFDIKQAMIDRQKKKRNNS